MPKGKQVKDDERRNLQELVLKYKNIVENTQTDAVPLQKKRILWDKIAMEFNANSDNTQKDVGQLKNLWENTKFRRKAELAAEKRSLLMTDGGPPPEKFIENPELDACSNVDIALTDTIDSDTLLLLQNEPFHLVEDTLVLSQNVVQAEESFPSTSKDGNIRQIPGAGECHTRKQTNLKRGLDYTDQVNSEGKKKSKYQAFTEEAELRIEKASYLLQLEKEIGEMRKTEQQLRTELVKQQLEEEALRTELLRKQLQAAENEEAFLKEKRALELEILKNRK